MTDHTHDWLENTVRREGGVMFSAHPSAEDLVLHAEAGADLPAEKRRAIEAHLRVCAECTDDRTRLGHAARELQEVGEPQHAHSLSNSSSELAQRLRAFFAPRQWIPAVVAVAVTVAILGPQTDAPIVHPVGRTVVLRGDVERGAAPVVSPTADGRLALSFVLSGTGEGPIDHCDVSITAADGRIVADVAEIAAFDDYGTFVLTVDVRDLASGNYTLTAHDRIGSRHFAFDLLRDPPK